MKRSALVLVALTMAVVLSAVDDARAGTYQQIYRGLDLLATPSGFPVFTTGDGTRVNGSRSGRLRVVPTGLGPGYELQFDRSFGSDSRGRAETFHLGGLGELTLAGATQMTLGYSGDKFRTISGDVNFSNVGYLLRSQLGVQDATLAGTFTLRNAFELNPLGFYRIQLDASNTNSQLRLDGVLAEDVDSTNFNIGPIVVDGNLYLDALLALLTTLGVDTSEWEGVFPGSPIDRINDAIQDQLQEFQVTLDGVLGTTVTNPGLQTVLPADALQVTLDPDPLAAEHVGRGLAIPEPGTLLLLVAGVALWHLRRGR